MASRFWVGGTGTWDLVSTTHWSATTGGANGASAPGSADTVTFDASSGGGTVTPSFGGSATFLSITAGAFTGTIDFSINNDSVTCTSVTGFNLSGSGVRTNKLGSGTFNATFTWALTTTTNLTWDAGTSTIVIGPTSAGSGATFAGGALTYSTVQITPTTRTTLPTAISQSNTFASLQINGTLSVGTGTTQTVTSAFSINGSSGSPINVFSPGSQITFALGSSSCTVTWAALEGIRFTSSGSPAASNSFDCGNNTGITITQPSGGSSGMLFIPNMDGV